MSRLDPLAIRPEPGSSLPWWLLLIAGVAWILAALFAFDVAALVHILRGGS